MGSQPPHPNRTTGGGQVTGCSVRVADHPQGGSSEGCATTPTTHNCSIPQDSGFFICFFECQEKKMVFWENAF
jgi:hypothetical protein